MEGEKILQNILKRESRQLQYLKVCSFQMVECQHSDF